MKRLLYILALLLLVGVVSADTIIIYAPSTDADARLGYYEASGSTWASLRAKEANSITNVTANVSMPAIISRATTSGSWVAEYGYLWNGNSSVIPDDATIINATFSVYPDTVKQDQFGGFNATIISFSPVNPVQVTLPDWKRRFFNIYSDNISYTAWSPTARNNFTITNLSVISKTGYTSLLVTTLWDATNTSPVWQSDKITKIGFSDTSQSGQDKDPFLEVTYTVPDTTPPASITNLANNTATCTEINWTWTKPADADFNHTLIQKDGVFYTNLSNTTQYSLWTGLTGGQTYNISTKTYDTSGNGNLSWVNQSATATTCGSAPVSNFSANVTSGCSPLSVGFTDSTTNTPTNWDWYFWSNETKSSDLQNPSNIFIPGIYNIRLYTSNAYGNDWENKTAYVTVNDCTAPGPITGLTGAPTCNSIVWNWTDPTDADFDKVLVYKDGIWLKNVTAGIQGDTFTSLSELTAYLFSGRTIDTTGNLGNWTNLSKTTTACGSAPVADFIADNTNPCIGDTVTFTDLSTNTPTAWHWIVTGGWDSHAQNPTHIFDTEGPFSVNLTVSNAYGGDYELKPDYINVINCTPPVPTPIPNPIRQNKGQNIDLLTWIYNMFRSKLV